MFTFESTYTCVRHTQSARTHRGTLQPAEGARLAPLGLVATGGDEQGSQRWSVTPPRQGARACLALNWFPRPKKVIAATTTHHSGIRITSCRNQSGATTPDDRRLSLSTTRLQWRERVSIDADYA